MNTWFRICLCGTCIVLLWSICSYGQSRGNAAEASEVPKTDAAKADAPKADTAKGLNVVMVVEGSERMKEVDPMRLFAHAARMFVALLGKNDRAGVIRYVDKAEQLSDLTAIGDGSGRDTLFKAIDNISWQEADKEGADKEETGKVNALDAIDSAVKMLKSGGGSANGGGTGGAIILLYNVHSGVEEALGKSSVAETLNSSGIRLFAIAIGDRGKQESEQSDDVLCKPTGGFLYNAPKAPGIYIKFASIFESLTSAMMIPIERNKINIDESIKTIAFVIKKNSPTTKLSLEDPDGVRYLQEKKMEGVEWSESDTIDVIKIKDPVHGTWSLSLGYGRENKAYIQTILRLLVAPEDPYQETGKPLAIEAWFKVDNATLDMKEMQYGFKVKAEIVEPDGKELTLPLSAKMAGEGSKISYSNSFTPMKEGNYRVTITATGKGLERRRALMIVASKHGQPTVKPSATKTKLQAYDNRLDKFIFMRTTKKGDMAFTKAITFFLIINIVALAGIVVYAKKKGLWKANKSFEGQVDA
ncbi:MAG: VWA domain-containing protein [Nitrospirae bacterium]|uniref:VWA domain-containing protein n=1 Tax=Candidatus Magnetobacterium casense TaxID=1455061 RepID=UPI00058B4DCB|nr:VWA domain-containing protein [Candidatus Magnetobacterium casensis]MBF0337542.1 VWA domain-containing protein [Nitrospirota bacterium]